MINSEGIEQPVRVLIENKDTFLDFITNPSSIIALSAVLVSILSLMITARYNRITLQRADELNKKTVEPDLNTHGFNMGDKEVEGIFISYLVLKNCGLGPAKIKTHSFTFHDNVFTDFAKLLRAERPNLYMILDHPRSTYMVDLTNTTMAVGEEKELYNFRYNLKRNERIKVISFLSQVKLRIEYTSIYNEPKVLEWILYNPPTSPIKGS
ncbi:MAG: hypothetical protein V2B15_08215 [Bacteroidota bacterium]